MAGTLRASLEIGSWLARMEQAFSKMGRSMLVNDEMERPMVKESWLKWTVIPLKAFSSKDKWSIKVSTPLGQDCNIKESYSMKSSLVEGN